MKTVLIIDDSPTAAYVTQKCLLKHSIQSEAVTHLTEIVAATSRSDEFDSILLDVNMPVVDGQQLYSKLRDWGWTKGITFYSSEPPERLAELVAQAGNCYVQKDSGCVDLVDRVLACPGDCNDCELSATI